MFRLLAVALLLSASGVKINSMRSQPGYPYPPNPRCGLWIARGSAWDEWRLEGVSRESDRLTLTGSPETLSLSSASGNDTGRAAGSATGPVVEAGYPFSNIVASWNAVTPYQSALEIQVRARIGERWTGWYRMGRWSGPGSGLSVPEQSDADGTVEVDTLVLRHPASASQIRVEFAGRGGSLPQLTLASLCWFNPRAAMPAPPVLEGDWRRSIPVPAYSQMKQEHDVAGSICSPTSLSMILSYLGVSCSPMDVAAGVRDAAEDMYGNWPLNTAYAAARGCPAYIARFWSIEQLQNEIAAGRPVEASIRWSRGQLDGAPIPRSRGHLIVVIGFTASGDVIVNDPAAADASTVRRVYRRAQFLRAWQEGSGGIVYLVENPENSQSTGDAANAG